jgi:hypothetical protein
MMAEWDFVRNDAEWEAKTDYCWGMILIDWFIYWLIEPLYSAHVYLHEFLLSNAHGAYKSNVLACSHQVSHPEMKLISAAIEASLPVSLLIFLQSTIFSLHVFLISCVQEMKENGELQESLSASWFQHDLCVCVPSITVPGRY